MCDDVLFDKQHTGTDDQRTRKWTRWQPDPIHLEPRQPETAEQAVSTTEYATRLQNTLSRIRQEAQKNGYADGHAAGYAAGMKEGLAKGLDRGQKEGYQAGFDSGQQDGHDQAQQVATRLAALNQECATALMQIEADVGQALIALAIRIAETILHRTLDTEPDTILALIGDVLRLETGKSAVLKLRVNPADLILVRNYLQDEADTSLWRILPDDTITRGGCTAHTALGDIDATLETRWRRVVSSISGDT